MITKLNSKRIGLTVLSLIVFIVNFNLLHSSPFIDDQELDDLKDLAQQIADNKKERMRMENQEAALKNRLILKLNCAIVNSRVKCRALNILPEDFRINEDKLDLNYAKAALSTEIKKDQGKQLSQDLRIRNIKPINPERIIQNEILAAVLKAHLFKMESVIDVLKQLRVEVDDLRSFPGPIEQIMKCPDYIELKKKTEDLISRRTELFNNLEQNLKIITHGVLWQGNEFNGRKVMPPLWLAKSELETKFDEYIKAILSLDSDFSRFSRYKNASFTFSEIKENYKACFIKLLYPPATTEPDLIISHDILAQMVKNS